MGGSFMNNNTFSNLKTLANLYIGSDNLSEVAEDYQQDKSPVKLAYVVCRLEHYLKTQTNKYWGLTDEDKESFMLEEVDRAMLHYNPDKGAKVQTLISIYVNNRLRTETQQLQYDKRSANNAADSYEEIIATKENDEVECTQYLGIEMSSLLNSAQLTESEMACCKIIMQEPHALKNTEIADMLGMTSAGVGYLKKRIAVKLAGVI
jgi:DNA-binding CsgD family transcriptional regulator